MESGRAPRGLVVMNFAAVYLVWGSTYLAIRYAVETIPPFLMAGTRFLISGAILYLWTRSRGEARPVRANWRAAAIIGFFLLVGGNGGVVWAEQRVPSGLTALLVASVPLWVVLLEWAGGAQRPTGRVWLGIAIGFVGLGILVGPSEVLGGNSVDGWGAAALVGASVTWAIGSVASRRVDLPRSPLLGTGMEMLTGGVPENTVAIIDDSGGTLTAPILGDFTAVVCMGGTVRSHLGILTREYNVPCLMNATLDGLADGDTVLVEYSKPAADAYADAEAAADHRPRIIKVS